MENYKELFLSLLSDPSTVTAVINQYKPLVYSVAGELFGIYKDYVDNEEVTDYSAKALANKYQALIKYGFTDEQAFLLLLDSETVKRESLRNMSKSGNSKITIKD